MVTEVLAAVVVVATLAAMASGKVPAVLAAAGPFRYADWSNATNCVRSSPRAPR